MVPELFGDPVVTREGSEVSLGHRRGGLRLRGEGGAGAGGGGRRRRGYAWGRGLRKGLIHTPSDSSPISKQKQARRREEPAACRDKPGEKKRQKNREKRRGGGKEVSSAAPPTHPSVPDCPGARGQSVTGGFLSPHSLPARYQTQQRARVALGLQTRRDSRQRASDAASPSGISVGVFSTTHKIQTFPLGSPDYLQHLWGRQSQPEEEGWKPPLQPNRCSVCVPRRTSCHLQMSQRRRPPLKHPKGQEMACLSPAPQQHRANPHFTQLWGSEGDPGGAVTSAAPHRQQGASTQTSCTERKGAQEQ